jgi:hypothetical protein
LEKQVLLLQPVSDPDMREDHPHPRLTAKPIQIGGIARHIGSAVNANTNWAGMSLVKIGVVPELISRPMIDVPEIPGLFMGSGVLNR